MRPRTQKKHGPPALRSGWARGRVVAVVATVVLAMAVPIDVDVARADGASSASVLVSSPSSLVDPLDGTGAGAVSPGTIGEYPGAVVPFGMMQWSPDTSPDRAAGSGYSYRDSHISGFSLTHLSGTGCPSYGDIGVLPIAGAVPAEPEQATSSFSHAHETAHPGFYGVRLQPAGIDVALTVTARTGLGRFTFPSGAPENVLFKVADSANPVTASAVSPVGADEITGQVTSGQFCQTGTPYTLYFVARFDRAFVHAGTFTGHGLTADSAACSGTSCGAYVTFDPNAAHEVEMQVGISFVSEAGAQANLATEDPGWSLGQLEHRATAAWDRVLGKIDIGGGTAAEQRTFYTALYHSLLDPSVVSDDSGQYVGDDHQMHHTDRSEYSNFSEWDIYRSEIELLSVVAPGQTADMMQSLVDDAQQNGWLPKWAIPGGDESQMNGDSADPIIASAYAFGIRDFDTAAALQAMVKGATQDETAHGLEIERQYLDQYLAQHYVDAGSLDLTSIDYSIGGSVTLEYALDDFAIAQMAASLGDQSTVQEMTSRAQNWQYLFDPATGYIEAKNPDGSFAAGPAFQRALFEPGGEKGFEEGNAIQYTWAVPQNLAGLAALMGGDSHAVASLNRFFSRLNAGRFEPYDWAGNEPSMLTPWEYDAFGDPARTQTVVREIATTLYHDAPVDEPGNDDLGALSSWYVWAAIGLYPATPGTATLSLASPLFPEVSISLSSGKRLRLLAPGASAGTPYIHSLTVQDPTPRLSGAGPSPGTCSSPTPSTTARRGNAPPGTWQRTWLPGSVITTGATVRFGLSRSPDPAWGTSPSDATPSDQTGQLPALGYSVPSGGTTVVVGRPSTVQIGVDDVNPGVGTTTWAATASPGFSVAPASGSLRPATSTPGGRCSNPPPQALAVGATAAGQGTITVAYRTASGVALPPVVIDITATSAH